MKNRKKNIIKWFDIEHPCGLSLKTREKEVKKIKEFLANKAKNLKEEIHLGLNAENI